MKKNENEMILKETGVIKMKAELKRNINSYLKYCNKEDLNNILDYIKNLQGVSYLFNEINNNKNIILLTEYHRKIKYAYEKFDRHYYKINLHDYFTKEIDYKIWALRQHLNLFIDKIHKYTSNGKNIEYIVNYANSKTRIEHLIDIDNYNRNINDKIHNILDYLKYIKEMPSQNIHFKCEKSKCILEDVIKYMEELYQYTNNIEEYFFEELKYQESINN